MDYVVVEASSRNIVQDEKNNITCTAVGNNKLEAKATYKVNMSKTLQKSAIFFGDSIVYGFLSNGYSWANYIGDNYERLLFTN